MKINTIILLVILILSSCKESHQKKESLSNTQEELSAKKNVSLDSFLIEVIKYVPKNVDLSKCEFIEMFDVNHIFDKEKYSNKKNLKDKAVNMLLLKQYLFHLRNSNQGYDLKSMMKGNTETIINYFLIDNDIDTSLEFINSSIVFSVLKENPKTDEDIKQLQKEIQKEIDRINHKN